MKKVVINSCFGGYQISDKVAIEMFKIKNNLDKVYVYRKKHFDDVSSDYVDEDDLEFDENNNLIGEYYSDIYLSPTYVGNRMTSIYKSNHKEVKYLLSLTMNEDREDELLISFIEKLGSEKCSGSCGYLKIVEIPSDIEYEIDSYDGVETIHEVHRSWN